MKVSQAFDFHLQYHQANSKKNTVKICEFVLTRFAVQFGKRDLASISTEEVLAFLLSLTKDNKQATKRNRYSVLASFYNFSINTGLPALTNPCNTAVIKKIFKRPLAIQNPKSGRTGEAVYVPRKLLVRLSDYVRTNKIGLNDRIFPISYVAAWSMVKKAGNMVDIELRPHDLRRHAATYASRSGTPIEIVSKVILRHADLSTTQRYLGKVNDSEAIRWIETLYG